MPSDYETDIATAGDGIPTLPDDVQELYQTLQHEGASWRRSAAPEIERVNQRLRSQVALLSAQRPAEEAATTTATTRHIAQPLVTVSAPSGYGKPGSHRLTVASHLRGSGPRRWITTGATLAVIAGFVSVLALAAVHRPTLAPQKGDTSGSAVTGVSGDTGAAPSGWVSLSKLDYSAVFSANDPPAIAPSDPNVIYETMAQGLQEHAPASMRATSDGGKTWRTLALPLPADHIGYAGISVSPANPQVVFLSLIDTVAADCPANRLESMGEGSGSLCRLEYTSVDGGAHWRATNLPLAGGVPGLLTASANSGLAGPILSNSASVQGERLFSGFLCVDFGCTRLLSSADGGVTWSFADQGMLAGGAKNVCDYAASAASATLYAATSAGACGYNQQQPYTLWTSHDAGASWTKVGVLATSNERGMVVAQDSATGASLLYMGLPRTTAMSQDKMGDPFPVISQSPSDVLVSVDGGQTWQHAPTQGIPAGHSIYFQIGPLGTLRDGSVLMDVIPTTSANGAEADNFSGSAIYAWKPGDTSWRYITSVNAEIDGLLVTTAASGKSDTFRAILVNRSGQGTTFAFIQQDGIR
ncbi:MAG TPA: hypothetical protein VHI51_21580 [Ktedonobacterales bacterium]|jgi:hypothetical protein|nr:hypothetical protein [Ktedonobacterales bacterium]